MGSLSQHKMKFLFAVAVLLSAGTAYWYAGDSTICIHAGTFFAATIAVLGGLVMWWLVMRKRGVIGKTRSDQPIQVKRISFSNVVDTPIDFSLPAQKAHFHEEITKMLDHENIHHI